MQATWADRASESLPQSPVQRLSESETAGFECQKSVVDRKATAVNAAVNVASDLHANHVANPNRKSRHQGSACGHAFSLQSKSPARTMTARHQDLTVLFELAILNI
jgi:hypothetical protein